MIRYCKRTTFGKVSMNQLLIEMKLAGKLRDRVGMSGGDVRNVK